MDYIKFFTILNSERYSGKLATLKTNLTQSTHKSYNKKRNVYFKFRTDTAMTAVWRPLLLKKRAEQQMKR